MAIIKRVFSTEISDTDYTGALGPTRTPLSHKPAKGLNNPGFSNNRNAFGINQGHRH
jgi:hypothetical protein